MKDYTRYLFQNQSYNKGRLVNAVVAYYVRHHPNATYQEIQRVFPDEVQKGPGTSYGVLRPLAEAERVNNIVTRFGNQNKKRYHVDSELVVRAADGPVATCTEWNTVNIAKFIAAARRAHLDIRAI